MRKTDEHKCSEMRKLPLNGSSFLLLFLFLLRLAFKNMKPCEPVNRICKRQPWLFLHSRRLARNPQPTSSTNKIILDYLLYLSIQSRIEQCRINMGLTAVRGESEVPSGNGCHAQRVRLPPGTDNTIIPTRQREKNAIESVVSGEDIPMLLRDIDLKMHRVLDELPWHSSSFEKKPYGCCPRPSSSSLQAHPLDLWSLWNDVQSTATRSCPYASSTCGGRCGVGRNARPTVLLTTRPTRVLQAAPSQGLRGV